MTLREAWYETPDLVGDHVELVRMQQHHAAGILWAADDDEVFRWQSFARPTSLDEAEGLLNWYAARPKLRKHMIRRDGSWRDTVVFSMTDDEWPDALRVLEERLAR